MNDWPQSHRGTEKKKVGFSIRNGELGVERSKGNGRLSAA